MEAEHFGISIVQMLAAGIIVLAHNSAGPRFDIIKDSNYLANSEEEYFSKMARLVELTPKQKVEQATRLRNKMLEYGEEQFK